MDYAQQSQALISKISAVAVGSGASTAAKMAEASDPLLEWIGYLSHSQLTGCCDFQLDGIRSLVLESVSSASIGLYRSSILAMRGQIDLAFGWLFFKNHPIEWARVVREGEGFKLKRGSLEYLNENLVNFQSAFQSLRASSKFGDNDPYKILSAHIHSIGLVALPKYAAFEDIIGDVAAIDACVEMQGKVSEFISDIFLSSFGSSWASLPEVIMEDAKLRLVPAKLAVVTHC